MNNITYTTNPDKRCMYCKGREVKTFINGTLINNSLNGPFNGFYKCKDKKECLQNIEAENTQVIVSNKGFKVVKDYGEPIIEVEFENDIIKRRR